MTSKKRITGDAAEKLVLDYLSTQGLQLVTRNYSCRAGEIDLIMLDGEQLVFVEVRYRARSDFGSAAESVTATKQRKLIITAQYYLQQTRQMPACRFDVAGVDKDGHIDWIKDAFPGG